METGQMFMTQMPTMATVAMAATTPTLPITAEDASGIDFAAVLQSVAPVVTDNNVAATAEGKPPAMHQMPETAVSPAFLEAVALAVQPEIMRETAAPFSGLPVQAKKMVPDAEKSDDLIEKEATKEAAAGLPQEVALDAAGAQLAQALQLSGRMSEPELSESETKSTPVVMSSRETTPPAQMQQVREAYSQPVVAAEQPKAEVAAAPAPAFEAPKPQAVTTAAPVVEAAPKLQTALATVVAATPVKPVVTEEQLNVEVAAAPVAEAPKPQTVTTAAPVVETPKLQTATATVVAGTPVKPAVAVEAQKAEVAAAPAPAVEEPKTQAVATAAPVVEATPKLQAAPATVVVETTAKPVAAVEAQKAEVAAAPAPAVEAPKPQAVATAAPVVETAPELRTAPTTVVVETTAKPVVAVEQPKAEVAAVPAPAVEAPKLQTAQTPVVAGSEQTKTIQETQQTPVTQQQFLEAYSKPVAAKPVIIARAEAQTAIPETGSVIEATETVAPEQTASTTETSTVPTETAAPRSEAPSAVRKDMAAAVVSEAKVVNPQISRPTQDIVPVTAETPSEPVQAAELTAGVKRVAESGAVPVRTTAKGNEPQPREERSLQQTTSAASGKPATGGENLLSAALKEPSSTTGEEAFFERNPEFDQKMTGHLQNAPIRQNNNSAAPVTVSALAEQPQPALTEHLVKQVTERIAAHEIKSGADQIVLRLTPENMGEVKVNLRMENQRLTVEIMTENKAVTDALRQNSDSLKETLAKQNIKMESFDVSTGGGNENLAGRSNRSLNEWQEMARNKQANQWQQGGYAIPQVAVADNAPTLASYRSNSLVDVHY